MALVEASKRSAGQRPRAAKGGQPRVACDAEPVRRAGCSWLGAVEPQSGCRSSRWRRGYPRRSRAASWTRTFLTDLIADLEVRIPSLLPAANVPGLSIAVVRNAQVAWSRGFGVKASTSKAPVDTATLFEAGSVSKTVFVYAVMKLSEKGLLGLDTPLTKYLSERSAEGRSSLRLDHGAPGAFAYQRVAELAFNQRATSHSLQPGIEVVVFR